MAGKIITLIDSLIEQRAKGSKILEGVVKTKLILKGINPKDYDRDSPDDPIIMGKLFELMNEQK